MNYRRFVPILFIWLITGIACRQEIPVAGNQPVATRMAAPVTVRPTLSPTATASPEKVATTAPSSLDDNEQLAATTTRPPAMASPDRFDPAAITAAERAAAASLQESPPDRDDVKLARAYSGRAVPAATTTPFPAPNVGATRSLNVLNTDNNTVVPIEATLRGVSDSAYFWFDDAAEQPDREAVAAIGDIFDVIYRQTVAAFGQERRPGIDGDVRVHIVHAMPGALCDDGAVCGLAGYFSGRDGLPRIVNPRSNELDMFVMNATLFGSGFYLSVLAHEFRHMIEENYDVSDADWEVEGSAVLAEELAGFGGNALASGNAFLAEPDQQLNRWSDGSTFTYYGMGYVLNRYIYDRLGPDLYREFATHPTDGLAAVTAVAQTHDLGFDGASLWQDWLAALAIHSHPNRPQRYSLGDSALDTAAMTQIIDYPTSFDTTVHQFAADYYHLTGKGTATVGFGGSRRVPVLDAVPPSGRHFWLANRGNYGHAQLTRAFDLGNASTVTLHYNVFQDIEYSYDFAYVSVSTDGGATWRGLVAEGMQGEFPADDPSGSALTERFYTGEEAGWKEETIDLSAYSGRKILLRFSYITDPILTFSGLALDEISIPEIGFYDSAETPDGAWTAAGFTRATATLPQEWLMQLITFPEGTPVVSPLPVDESGRLTATVDLSRSNGEAILIVAARAPQTLEQAHYQLTFDQE